MSSSSLDFLIRGGKVVDGSGNPWFYGDVGIKSDRVAVIAPAGRLSPGVADEVVDASGMIVSPGFIDIQSHSIVPLMVDGRCLSKILQGVTTEIMGEGHTPAPVGGKTETMFGHSPYRETLEPWREKAAGWHRFGDWLQAMEDAGVSPNVGSFLGGGTLRSFAKGLAMGRADAEELSTMHRVMKESMEDGAFGVSYALIYPPDTYVDTDEIVEMCRIVGEYGGVYITHVRSEGRGLIEGIAEAIEIGRRAGCPVEIYHLKASGKSNWHKMPRVIEMIDEARAEGVDVTSDMYPYTASGTGLTSVLPPWIAADGKLFQNLRDPEIRAKLVDEVLHPTGEWEALGRESEPSGVMPIGFQKPENQQYVAMRLSDIAEQRGQNWVEAAIDLLISEEQRIGTIYFMINEDNLRNQLTQPWIKVSTDAGGMDPAWAKPAGPVHPRAYGTYPRVLGKYVREEKLLTLEDAVRKMTSSVADRLSLRDRGSLRTGCYADVVIFDPETIGVRATFDDPHQLSVGVRDVWVNGQRVVSGGTHTGAKPGKFVKGAGART